MTMLALKESVLEALEGLQLPWEEQLKRLVDRNFTSSEQAELLGGPGVAKLYELRMSRPRRVYSIYTLETNPRDAIFGGPTGLDSDEKVRAWGEDLRRLPLEAVVI